MKAWIGVLLVFAFAALPLAAQEKEAERMEKAAEVLNEVIDTPEGISADLLNKAVC
ncbi:MAG: hypothetical protein HY525_14320, partial [Betaproteobacteria bacterium]|nr:hypothetical protein [Betaproteobacteria bacterium]